MTKEQLFIHLVERLSVQRLFHGHAVVDAEDEAMMVMMKLCQQNVEQILSTGDEVLTNKTVQQANKCAQIRLNTLAPMAYVLNEVYFAQLRFISDNRALVPRSPIAELILSEFKPWLNIKNATSVLDLCTGSGCIGISMAKHFPHLQVDISDLSLEALSLAQENIDLQQVNSRVKLYHSDLFDSLSHQYDIIISNPPYVSEEEFSDLPVEYHQEPKLGLVSEQFGLKIPVQILLQVSNFLSTDGFLFLEVGYNDGILSEAFPRIDFQWVDFLNGGQGVCVFNRKKLLEYRSQFKVFLEN